MPKFEIKVTEKAECLVDIEAENVFDAIDKLEDAYYNNWTWNYENSVNYLMI